VISPLKIESCVTSLSAFAAAFVSTDVVALAVVDAALTIDPSPGYWKTFVVAGTTAGGELTVVVAALVWPGTTMLIASALAAAPGVRASPPAPAGTKATSTSRSGSARRRRTALESASGCG
jgi:hypothetical protein